MTDCRCAVLQYIGHLFGGKQKMRRINDEATSCLSHPLDSKRRTAVRCGAVYGTLCTVHTQAELSDADSLFIQRQSVKRFPHVRQIIKLTSYTKHQLLARLAAARVNLLVTLVRGLAQREGLYPGTHQATF